MTYSDDLPPQDYSTEDSIPTADAAEDRADELGHYAAANDKGRLLAQEKLNRLKRRFPPVKRELQQIFDETRAAARAQIARDRPLYARLRRFLRSGRS